MVMNVPVEVVVTVPVEHVRVCTATPFSEVVRHIEAACGIFDGDRIKEVVAAGAPASTTLEEVAKMAGESGLMRFATFDHGWAWGSKGIRQRRPSGTSSVIRSSRHA